MDFDQRRTLSVRPFLIGDLIDLEEADDISAVKSKYTIGEARELMASEYAFTVIAPDGMIVACTGVHSFWTGYGLCWTFVSVKVKPYMTALVGVLRELLHNVPFHRLEAAVDVDFRNGHRLVQALGFKKECVMRKFSSDKRDHVLYSIVRDI